MLKSTYAQFYYLIAGADADQMDRMRDYLKTLCAGWNVAQVRAIVDETPTTSSTRWCTTRPSR